MQQTLQTLKCTKKLIVGARHLSSCTVKCSTIVGISQMLLGNLKNNTSHEMYE
jgi:hypothetical protein